MIAAKNARRIGVLVLVLALTGCGGASTPPPAAPPAAGHNEADVAFVRTMLRHGEQGAAMADLAAKNATRPEVAQLATDLRAAQEPETARLAGYLTAWGAPTAGPAPTAGRGDRARYDPVAELRNVSGDQFDTLFLQLMIAHHQTGLSAAHKEVEDGSNPDATALAGEIVTEQDAEIERMQKLITS